MFNKKLSGILAIIFMMIIGFSMTACPPPDDGLPPPGIKSRMLHVEGQYIKNDEGKVIRLTGVNLGTLLHYNTHWPSLVEVRKLTLDSIKEAITNWNCNVFRLALVQDRWFGHMGIYDGINGDDYKKVVDDAVQLIASYGKYVILDIHHSSVGGWGEQVCQHAMPDDNSAVFWKDVARRYANHPAVLFDLYNEPFPGFNRNMAETQKWDIWKNGGTFTEAGQASTWDNINDGAGETVHILNKTYHTPGMQELLNVVRREGANNIIIAGGIFWGSDLWGISNGYALTDSVGGNGIVYSTHIYPWHPLGAATGVVTENISGVVGNYPIIVGEIGINIDDEYGEGNGASSQPYWLEDMLDLFDQNKLNWTAWCFDAYSGPPMLKNWSYEPTDFHGAICKRRLRSYPEFENTYAPPVPKPITGNIGSYEFGHDYQMVCYQMANWIFTGDDFTRFKNASTLELVFSSNPSHWIELVWQDTTNWDWHPKNILGYNGSGDPMNGASWNRNTKTLTITLSEALADYTAFQAENVGVILILRYYGTGNINDLGILSANIW